jgi:hypothetical protein
MEVRVYRTPVKLSVERYVHLGITAQCGLIHGGGDAVEIQTHYPPSRFPEHNNGYFSPLQILLISKVLVGG